MLPGNSKTARTLRALALRHEGVEEGIACKGTKLESATFGVGKKNFLFVGLAGSTYTVRLKLEDSVAQATAEAKRRPQAVQVGAGGWTKLTFTEKEAPQRRLLESWIEESYRCVTGGG